MIWRLLADLVAGLHYAFLAYLIAGGFLAWRWPRTIWLHLVTAVWGVLIIVTKVPCPLTWLQNSFRSLGGQPRLRTGFIQAYVRGTFYPASQERLSQIVVGTIVLASWLGYARLLHHHRCFPLSWFRRTTSQGSKVVTSNQDKHNGDSYPQKADIGP